MAGINKDEGLVLVVHLMAEILTKNLTKADFENFFTKVVEPIFHSINLDMKKVTDFYLNNTDINDSNAIK